MIPATLIVVAVYYAARSARLSHKRCGGFVPARALLWALRRRQ